MFFKTAAFALPILQLMHEKNYKSGKQIKALILAPTRELALQINESFSDYRRSDSSQAAANAKELKVALQTLAQEHPNLISKVADFQSRIDEQLRNQDFRN